MFKRSANEKKYKNIFPMSVLSLWSGNFFNSGNHESKALKRLDILPICSATMNWDTLVICGRILKTRAFWSTHLVWFEYDLTIWKCLKLLVKKSILWSKLWNLGGIFYHIWSLPFGVYYSTYPLIVPKENEHKSITIRGYFGGLVQWGTRNSSSA